MFIATTFLAVCCLSLACCVLHGHNAKTIFFLWGRTMLLGF